MILKLELRIQETKELQVTRHPYCWSQHCRSQTYHFHTLPLLLHLILRAHHMFRCKLKAFSQLIDLFRTTFPSLIFFTEFLLVQVLLIFLLLSLACKLKMMENNFCQCSELSFLSIKECLAKVLILQEWCLPLSDQ